MIKIEEIRYRFASAKEDSKHPEDCPPHLKELADFYAANTDYLCDPETQRKEQEKLLFDKDRMEKDEKKILVAVKDGRILGSIAFEDKNNNIELEAVLWCKDKNKHQELVYESALAWRFKTYALENSRTICGDPIPVGPIDFNGLLLKSQERRLAYR